MEDPRRNLITQHRLCAFICIYALVLGLGLIAVWVKLRSPLHLPHSWATGQTVCTVSSGILELCCVIPRPLVLHHTRVLCDTTPNGATPHTCTYVKSQCMDCCRVSHLRRCRTTKKTTSPTAAPTTPTVTSAPTDTPAVAPGEVRGKNR